MIYNKENEMSSAEQEKKMLGEKVVTLLQRPLVIGVRQTARKI